MTIVGYEIAKQVYEGALGNTQGRDLIIEKSGMNWASAGDFIFNFRAMMQGDRYTRTLSKSITRYYFENIHRDYGEEALQRALTASRKRIEYYATLGNGRLRGIERLTKEFETDSE